MNREITYQQDEKFYRMLLAQSTTGVMVFSSSKIHWANQPLAAMLGYSADEFLTLHPHSIIHPNDRQWAKRIETDPRSDTQVPETHETQLLRKNSQPLWVEVRTTPIGYKGQRATLTNVIDITCRKLAEQALLKSEQRLHELFENSAIGIYRIAKDGRMMAANPAFLDILNIDPKTQRLTDLHRQDFEPTFPRCEFKQQMEKQGRVTALESAWIAQDDTLLFVRENAMAVFDEDGRCLSYEGTVENITPNKKNQQELGLYAQRLAVKQEVDQAILSSESLEEILQAVVTSIGRFMPCDQAGVLFYDLDKSQRRMFTWTQGKSPDHLFSNEVDWKDHLETASAGSQNISISDQRSEFLNSLAKKGVRSTYNLPLVFADKAKGNLVLISFEPQAFRPDHDQIMLALGTQLQSALHQLHLSTRLKQERSRLATLLEHLPTGVLLLDENHHVRVSNPLARDYLSILTTQPKAPLTRLGDKKLDDIKTQDDGRKDFEVPAPTPDKRLFRVLYQPVASGQSTCYVMLIREITDERRLEKRMRQQERQAAIGALSGGVAHDFNNLLSAIEGCSWILLRNLGKDHPLIAPAKEIRRTCDRAAALCRQLLQFSRSKELCPRRININGVVVEMSQMLQRLLGSGIELSTDLDYALTPIKADPGQLEQVIVNLAINARDAMKNGGSLTIKTINEKPSDENSGRFIRLSVTDTGEGMDTGTLEHIFEPFFTTRESEGGTGLGLATVKNIVAQNAGSIQVRSSPAKGTTFHILLPCLNTDGQETSQ
jgi:PAS domain S-box-containing protein